MLDGYCNGSGFVRAYAWLTDGKRTWIRLIKVYVKVEKAPYRSWDEDEDGWGRPCEDWMPLEAETIKPLADNEFKVMDVLSGKFCYEYNGKVKVKEIIEILVNDIEPDLDTFVDENWQTYMETKAEEQMEKQWLERQGK